MVSFEDRERAFEAKYAHDEEVHFRVTARRDKLFARWTAEQLGLDEAARSELTRSILRLQDGAGHDAKVLVRAAEAASGRSRAPAPAELASALDRCAAIARHQLLQAGPARF